MILLDMGILSRNSHQVIIKPTKICEILDYRKHNRLIKKKLTKIYFRSATHCENLKQFLPLYKVAGKRNYTLL